MIKISISFMSVPKRRDNVLKIARCLTEQINGSGANCNFPTIYEDTNLDGPWESWKGAWLQHSKDITHHIVLQDDILVCADFPQTMIKLAEVRSNAPISGFLPRKSVDKARDQGFNWVSTKRFLWGQCLMLPVKMGDDALEWIAGNEGKISGWSHHDDVRLASYFSYIKTPVFIAVPHPVEHIGDELGSILGHYGAPGRRRGRAWRGEGEFIANEAWENLKCIKD